jgi:hypothetical protein
MPCFLLLIVIVPMRFFALNDRKRRRPVALLTSEPVDGISTRPEDEFSDTVIDAVAGAGQYAHLGKMDEFLALSMCSRHFDFSNRIVPSLTAIFKPIWQNNPLPGEEDSAIIVPIPFTVPYN